ADEVRKAAELGYEYLELSPRADFFFWHRYPKADAAEITQVKKACAETGVKIQTLVPVFNWASADAQLNTGTRVWIFTPVSAQAFLTWVISAASALGYRCQKKKSALGESSRYS